MERDPETLRYSLSWERFALAAADRLSARLGAPAGATDMAAPSA